MGQYILRNSCIPHMESRVEFESPISSTRSALWVPVRRIPSHTVQYDFFHVVLQGIPCDFVCGEFHPIQSHMVSFMCHHVKNSALYCPVWDPVCFINPRRPTRPPWWFPVSGISSHTVPYGFLYGPPCKKFCPILPRMGSRVFH